MDKIQKFKSDIQRIKKHARPESAATTATASPTKTHRGADNSPTATGGGAAKIGEEIVRLFENSNPATRELCRNLAGFWKEKYIDPSAAEISAEAEEKIAALMAFVNGDEDTAALDADDWTRVKDEVGFVAEDLPMEMLSAMMGTIVEKGALG